ncbi:MAG: hypothetical protein HY722_03380 [Planctomycetes bacterium]|nr:hypothetical protein [Planctomycetota bacterium]
MRKAAERLRWRLIYTEKLAVIFSDGVMTEWHPKDRELVKVPETMRKHARRVGKQKELRDALKGL